MGASIVRLLHDIHPQWLLDEHCFMTAYADYVHLHGHAYFSVMCQNVG